VKCANADSSESEIKPSNLLVRCAAALQFSHCQQPVALPASASWEAWSVVEKQVEHNESKEKQVQERGRERD
jgi:hypothetical protein